MKFRAVPVTSLEDATLDFEQAQVFLSNGDVTADATGRLAVVSKVLGGKTPFVANTGSATITWAGAADASVNIAHGLGRTPTWFSLSLLLSGQVAYLQATSVNGTTIAVNGRAAAVLTGSGTVYWAAT